MTYIIVLALYLGLLYLVAWASRRSMGVPTLTLAAGALLASLWTDSLTPIVAQTGIVIVQPPLTSIVSIALTLFPAFLVMMRSHKVSSRHHSLFGSLVFAVLGVVLTYGAFSNAVTLDAQSKQYIVEFVKYQNIIITTCVCLAILDVLFYKKPRSHEAKHKK